MNTVLEDTARHYMWLRLIPGYASMSATAKKKAKVKYAKDDLFGLPKDYEPSPADIINAKEQPIDCNTGKPMKLKPAAITLSDIILAKSNLAKASVPCVQYTSVTDYWTNNNNKKEKNMCYDCDCCDTPKSDELLKRQYLSDRLYEIANEKAADASKTFGLTNDTPPQTFNDLMDRLTSGKFVLSDEQKKKQYWYVGHIFDVIKWRDPAIKEDEDGYAAWYKKMTDAKKKAADQIAIADPKDALAALEAFESTTIQ